MCLKLYSLFATFENNECNTFQVGLEPTRVKPNCLVGSRNSHYAIGTVEL